MNGIAVHDEIIDEDLVVIEIPGRPWTEDLVRMVAEELRQQAETLGYNLRARVKSKLKDYEDRAMLIRFHKTEDGWRFEYVLMRVKGCMASGTASSIQAGETRRPSYYDPTEDSEVHLKYGMDTAW